MLLSLHRASGFLFYFLGCIAIAGIILVSDGQATPTQWAAVNSVDLPLVAAAMIYGGTSLIGSITHDAKRSSAIVAIVSVILIACFGFFFYLDFMLPVSRGF